MKNKTLLVLALVLLISNIILLYFYFNKPHKKGGGNMTERIAKEVGFNAMQKEIFAKNKESYDIKMNPLKDSLIQLKNDYITNNLHNTTDSAKQKYAIAKTKLLIKMEILNLESLQESKKICTPQQLPLYDSIIKKILLRSPKKGKK